MSNGWVHLGNSGELQARFSAAFDADPDYVWVVNTDYNFKRHRWVDLVAVPGTDYSNGVSWFTSNPGYIVTGITTDDQGWVYTIGWQDNFFPGDMHEIWVWRFIHIGPGVEDGSWVGNRLWQGVASTQSPGGGNLPAIVWNPDDSLIYFRQFQGVFTGTDYIRRLDPTPIIIDGPAETIWSSSVGGGVGLTLTSDNKLRWAEMTGIDSVVHSLDLDTMVDSPWSHEPPAVGSTGTTLLHVLAHHPPDPRQVIGYDQNNPLGTNGSTWRFLADGAGEVQEFYPEIEDAVGPAYGGYVQIYEAQISHDKTRGLMLVREATVFDGQWYRWQRGKGPGVWVGLRFSG